MRDPVKAAAQVVELMRADAIRTIGLGTGRRPLVHLQRRPRHRRRGGGHGRRPARPRPGRLVGGVRGRRGQDVGVDRAVVGSDGDRRRARDGASEQLDGVVFAIIQNTAPWTMLGERPLQASPAADLDRGLDLVAWRRSRRPPRCAALGAMLTGKGSPTARHLGGAPISRGCGSARHARCPCRSTATCSARRPTSSRRNALRVPAPGPPPLSGPAGHPRRPLDSRETCRCDQSNTPQRRPSSRRFPLCDTPERARVPLPIGDHPFGSHRSPLPLFTSAPARGSDLGGLSTTARRRTPSHRRNPARRDEGETHGLAPRGCLP